MPLPPYVPRSLVADRLPLIVPDGTPNRQYCVREMAASTVFVMLYIGAVRGSEQYLGPKHVYRMTNEQAARKEDDARKEYARTANAVGARWYEDTTREPIRDETLREGLVPLGAVTVREDIPTTSGKPRYALPADFAALFDPNMTGRALDDAIQAWQRTNLSPGALASNFLLRRGAANDASGIRVTFPNGETRQLSPGPSSVIAKEVVEVFASSFLERPVVLWLSESRNKVVARDDELAVGIGLHIDAAKDLPDLILADLGPNEPLLVFVEVVATDGAITSRRKGALLALTDAAGFTRSQVAFVTAFLDRNSAGFKKTVSALAWGSFAWFASEPDQLVILRDGTSSPASLASLIAGA